MPLDKALEIYSAQTLCDLGIFLSIVSFMLHLGRPAADRAFQATVPRIAGQMTEGLYALLQDGTLVVAVLAGFIHLNLDLMADIKIGLPFVPLATVALGWALLGRLTGRGPTPQARLRATSRRVALGAFLNTLGYVLVMEAPGSEYVGWGTGLLGALRALRSNQNPRLSILCFYGCFTALLGLALLGAYRVLRTAPEGPEATSGK